MTGYRTPEHGSPSDPRRRIISVAHRRMLLEESTVDPAVAEERGYYTARTGSEVPQDRGPLPTKPGLIVPMYSPDGVTRSYQLRPDHKGKGPKYWSPKGRPTVVDVHPRMLEDARHGTSPLLITEGAKTGDAATSRGTCTVVLAGVDMWNVPKTKSLRPCFDHINLKRPVYVAFDSDCMTKEGVQRALGELTGALEASGADVKVIYLPDAPDGSKQGVDDYLAAGGTVAELEMLARRFEPADFAAIRLSRDQELRASIRHLWDRWHAGDWMRFVGAAEKGNWQRGHTARDVMEALIELAAKSGKPDDRGIVVRVGLRRLSDLAAKTAPSAGHAIKHLEADGQLEILPETDRSKPRRYRLLTPARALYSVERGYAEGGGAEGIPPGCKGCAPPTAPRLRWSSPARPGRLVRRVEGATGRTVSQAVGENVFVPAGHRPYAGRLAPHRGAIIDALEDAGGALTYRALCEVLHRTPGRWRDFRRRILKRLEEAGVIEVEGDVVRLAGAWLENLDERRERDGEVEQAEKQVRSHRTDRERYRILLQRRKHGTPKASTEAVRRTRELRERRMREAREEDDRRRAPAPPALVELVARLVRQNGRLRLGLLSGIAAEEGHRAAQVPRAIEELGYRVERLPEFGNAEFVYPDRVAA